MFNDNEIPRFGDIFYADLGEPEKDSHIQKDERPVIIAQNNTANKHSPVVTIIPLTSSKSKKQLPVHVEIGDIQGLKKKSIALVEQITTIDKRKLKGEKVATLTYDTLVKLGKAMQIQSPFPT